MPDDEYRSKYSAAQKMQLLKSQQAKLEIRAMPAHSQLKLKTNDKKMRKKQRKLAQTSSSSKSKRSLASAGGGSSAGMTCSSVHKSDTKEQIKNDAQEALKWKRRTEYIYEAERISIKLKEISAECEKDIELRVAMDDIASAMDTLRTIRNEYYQFVHAQNNLFEKQIKLLSEFYRMQILELNGKVKRLRGIFKNIDSKLFEINGKLRRIAAQ